MQKNYRLILVWACLRVIYLNKLSRHKDSYAVSQEFSEWTTSFNDYSTENEAGILKVPNFNKENRTVE